MKISICVFENGQRVYYPDNCDYQASRLFLLIDDSEFMFDLVRGEAISSRYCPDHSLLCCLIKFDEEELNWFLDNPSRIKGLWEWLENMSKEEAKECASEPSSELPKAEIEEKAKEFDEKVNGNPLNDAEKKIALQMMTAVIKDAEIFSKVEKQKVDLTISVVLKSLPKALRKVSLFEAGGYFFLTGGMAAKYEITETSDELEKQYPAQFAVAKMFLEDKRWAECDSFDPEDVKILCKFISERMYSSKFYEFREKELANEDRSTVLEFYKFYRAFVKKSKNIELPDVLDSDRCKNIEPPEIFELYKFYKTVAKDKNIEISDVLNTDFYKFYKEAESDKFEIY